MEGTNWMDSTMLDFNLNNENPSTTYVNRNELDEANSYFATVDDYSEDSSEVPNDRLVPDSDTEDQDFGNFRKTEYTFDHYNNNENFVGDENESLYYDESESDDFFNNEYYSEGNDVNFIGLNPQELAYSRSLSPGQLAAVLWGQSQINDSEMEDPS